MNNDTISQTSVFRGRIVQKIYRVWLLRKLLPFLLLEIAVLSVLLYELGKLAFVQRVMENALRVLFNDPARIISFLVGMFGRAPIAEKILGVAVVILVALIIRHLTQGILRLILVKENYFSRIKP